MKPITPCLWFNTEAEQAARFYVSVFKKRSKIVRVWRYTKNVAKMHGRKPGSVLAVEFTLNGQPYMALNGGPHYKLNEAVSFQLPCKDQKEMDTYWNKLTKGGDKKAQQCGWLKDKFGLSWQIFPAQMAVWANDRDETKRERVMDAMSAMRKLDFRKLERAYRGK